MHRFIYRRLLQNVILLVFIVLAVFVMMRLTSGDPARIKAPIFASDEALQRYREEFGTNRSLAEQLWSFLSGLPHGDFGTSFRYQQPVFSLIWERVPETALLAVSALAIALVISLLVGVTGARRPGGIVDRVGLAVATFGQSAPIFWVGLMLVLIFSVRLGWFPAVGFTGWKSLVLPAIAVSLSIIPADLRVVRSAMLDTLNQEHIRTARAFGVSERRITFVYALRNAALPLVTVIGIDLGYLLGGTIVTEVVFNYPGVGQLAIDSVNSRDYPMVQAITILTATVFVFVNLAIDLLYMVLDPRIRIEA
ncbi:MAG: ABC transporter permease [Thermomicrobiales bacterium]|nr:ABC transporter permease [Thermomicrobiales bacterium]